MAGVVGVDLELGDHHSYRTGEEMIFRFHLYMWIAILSAAVLMYIGELNWVLSLLMTGWVAYTHIPNEPVEVET